MGKQRNFIPRRELEQQELLAAQDAPPNLPDDICRCWDAACPERDMCRRWLQREKGGAYVVHASTLRELKDGHVVCLNRIPTVP